MAYVIICSLPRARKQRLQLKCEGIREFRDPARGPPTPARRPPASQVTPEVARFLGGHSIPSCSPQLSHMSSHSFPFPSGAELICSTVSRFCSKGTSWVPQGGGPQAPRAPSSSGHVCTWDLPPLRERTGRPARLPAFVRSLPWAPCSALFWKVPCSPFRHPAGVPQVPRATFSLEERTACPGQTWPSAVRPCSTLGGLEQLPRELTASRASLGVCRAERMPCGKPREAAGAAVSRVHVFAQTHTGGPMRPCRPARGDPAWGAGRAPRGSRWPAERPGC